MSKPRPKKPSKKPGRHRDDAEAPTSSHTRSKTTSTGTAQPDRPSRDVEEPTASRTRSKSNPGVAIVLSASKTSPLRKQSSKSGASPVPATPVRGRKKRTVTSAEKEAATAPASVGAKRKASVLEGGTTSGQDANSNEKWPEKQEQLLLETYRKARAGKLRLTEEQIVKIFNGKSLEQGFKERNLRGCQSKMQRLCSTDKNYKYSVDQKRFLFDLQNQGLKPKIIAERYEKERHNHDPVWPERSSTILGQFLRRTSPLDVVAQTASSQEPGGSSAPWTKAEDDQLRAWFDHSHQELKNDQVTLNEFTRSQGEKSIYRSLQAIKSRIDTLKKNEGYVKSSSKSVQAEKPALNRRPKPTKDEATRPRKKQKSNSSASVVGASADAKTTASSDVAEQPNANLPNIDNGLERAAIAGLSSLRSQASIASDLLPPSASEVTCEATGADADAKIQADDSGELLPAPVSEASCDVGDLPVACGSSELSSDAGAQQGQVDGSSAELSSDAFTVQVESGIESTGEDAATIRTAGTEESDDEDDATSQVDDVDELLPAAPSEASSEATGADDDAMSQADDADADAMSQADDADADAKIQADDSGELLPAPVSEASCDVGDLPVACGSSELSSDAGAQQGQVDGSSAELSSDAGAQQGDGSSAELSSDAHNDQVSSRAGPTGTDSATGRSSNNPGHCSVAAHNPTAAKIFTSAAFVNDISAERFQPGSPFRAFLLAQQDRQSLLAVLQLNRIVPYGESDAFGVQFTVPVMRQILFVITALVHNRAMKCILLRELWSSSHTWSYGRCRELHCCLKYDALHPNYVHAGRCRHWTYLQRTQVHLSGFQGVHDYRLALALSTHMEMIWALDPSKTEDERDEASWRAVHLRAFAPLDMCFDEWSSDQKHPRLAFRRLIGLFPSVDMANASNWDFGVLRYTREGYSCEAQAVLVYHNCWLFVTNMQLERFSGRRPQLEWKKLGSLQNYVRRFSGIEQAANYPLARLMATRQTGTKFRCGKDVARIVGSPLYEYFRQELDEDQFRVVHALLLTTGIILNDGPFGCGKTTTLSACAIAFILFFGGERIALVSETNAAIDEDLRRIVKRLQDPALKAAAAASGLEWLRFDEIIRLGDMSDEMADYEAFSLKVKIDALRSQLLTGELSKAQRRAVNKRLYAAETEWLSTAKIIVGTTTQFQRESVRALHIPVIICDEAAQTCEAALMQVLRAKTHTALLAGDRRQLPTYSNLPESLKVAFEDGIPHHNLDSLLHSIPAAYAARGKPFPGVIVRSVYRCHPRITYLLQVFYDIELVARRPPGEDYLSGLNHVGQRAQQGERIRLIGLQHRGDNANQMYNMPEVAMAIALVLKVKAEVKRRDLSNKRIMIVTPYRDQRARLMRELRRLRDLYDTYVHVTVMTSDSSQGSEADVVVVSFTRTRTMGFLDRHPERTLVSLSRARDYLFILAKPQVFKENVPWQRLTQKADTMGIPHESVEWDERDAIRYLDDSSTLRKIAYCRD